MRSVVLTNVHPDLYAMILAEQKRIKEHKGTRKFSIESTIYCIIREYEGIREPVTQITEEHRIVKARSVRLKTITPTIFQIIFSEQNRLKEFIGRNQFSMERTIYHILREYARIKAIPSHHNV
jgi:hypothetical protein